MKKIIILLLGCELEKFKKQYNACKDTWLSVTEQYDNIDYFIIRSSNKNEIDFNRKIIWVNCEDDLQHTYDKDRLAFQVLEDNNIEFDYIVRTNTSIYVNIDALNKYCQLISDENVHCADICYAHNIFYPVGKIVIFNRKHVNTIINSPSSFTGEIDDYLIGKALISFGISVFRGLYIWYHIQNHHMVKNEITNTDLFNTLFVSVKVPEDNIDMFKSEEIHMITIHDFIKDYKFTDENMFNIINCTKRVYDNIKCCVYDYEECDLRNRKMRE